MERDAIKKKELILDRKTDENDDGLVIVDKMINA